MELLAATIRHAATNKAAGFQCREENPRWADPPLGFSYPTAEGKASHGRVWASLGSYKPSALPSPPSASPQPRLGTRRTRCTRPSQQALKEGAHEYLRYLEQKQKVKDRAFGFICFEGNLKSKTPPRSGSAFPPLCYTHPGGRHPAPGAVPSLSVGTKDAEGCWWQAAEQSWEGSCCRMRQGACYLHPSHPVHTLNRTAVVPEHRGLRVWLGTAMPPPPAAPVFTQEGAFRQARDALSWAEVSAPQFPCRTGEKEGSSSTSQPLTWKW